MKYLIASLLLMMQCSLSAKIYDCFTFFNELELLKVRFEELYDSVDHFVIVESKTSFTGKDKPLYFAENAEAFEKYKDKIIHIIVDYFPDLTGDAESDHWKRETHSRNAILMGLTDCDDNDIIFISDLDEIPSKSIVPEIVKYLTSVDTREKSVAKEDQWVCNLEMRLFMYQMNRENFVGWSGGSKATFYWMVKKYTPWGIKLLHHTRNLHLIENAGWHFNTMGGKEKALYKWLLTGPLYDNEPWLNELGKREDFLEMSYQGQIKSNTVSVPIDDSYPQYVLDNLEYFYSIGWMVK